MLAHLLIAIEVALCGVMTGSRDVLHSTHAITLLCVYYCTVVCLLPHCCVFTAALFVFTAALLCVYCCTVVCLLLHCCVYTANKTGYCHSGHDMCVVIFCSVN